MLRYIKGMSFSRSEVIDKIQRNIDQSINHIICLIAFPSCSAVNHWKDEIYSHLNDMYKLSGTKKFPKKQFIYDYTYGKRQDLLTDERYFMKRLSDVERKEGLQSEFDLDEVMTRVDEVCCAYYDWLAQKLSTDGYVTHDEVIEKLTEIIGY